MRVGVEVIVVVRGLWEDSKALLYVCDSVMMLFSLEAESVENRQQDNVELSGLYTNVWMILLLYLAVARGRMELAGVKAVRAMRGICIKCIRR